MMILENGTRFIWENARHLERAIFAYRFDNGPAARILQILQSYQNADGGFGHALEPDLRAPASQPLFVEFALHTLYECHLRDTALAGKVCAFLAQHADLQQGIPTLLPSARPFPKAPHWTNPAAEQPSFDRLTGLVGLLLWQGVVHAARLRLFYHADWHDPNPFHLILNTALWREESCIRLILAALDQLQQQPHAG